MKIASCLMGVVGVTAAVSVAVSTPAQARSYGPAGCGLGSLIFEPNSGFTQIFALAKDIARGQGETIDSLSRLAGCRASGAVGSSLQRRFDQIFTNASASDSQVGENVIEALRSDAALACSALDAG
jgi:hypothetical protein